MYDTVSSGLSQSRFCDAFSASTATRKGVDMTDTIFDARCIEVDFAGVPAYTFSMPVRDLVYIYYVAVRGRTEEEGAVQRPLNSRRIESIKDYILDGNMFFNSFILNWTAGVEKVRIESGSIGFPLMPLAAQAIDGQHRLAGLEEAIKENGDIESQNVIVTMCLGLDTKRAAKIFLNINTEQKPVPRSLIFDLFGLVEDDPNHAINRATDIAKKLNEDDNSPLLNLIKFPGADRGVGKIELSTFVSSLKRHLDKDGVFSKTKLRSFEHQVTVIRNYFDAIKNPYVKAKLWHSTANNPFFKAAGFNGAVDFLCESLMTKCAERGSFSVETMSSLLKLDGRSLLQWGELKSQDGKTARKNVAKFLEEGLLQDIVKDGSYKF